MQANDTSVLLRDYATGGSESAFKEIVRRHIDLVYSTALRHVGRDAQLAADVTQTTFTDLARKAASLPAGVVLAGWLHQHTCYRAATAVRAEIRRRTREQKAAEMNAIEQTDNKTWHRLAPLLDEALQRLPGRDRDAMVLRFFEDKSLAETARAIGISEDAAQKLVSRAVEKLRVHFSRHGVQVAAGSMAAAITHNAVRAAPLGLAATTSRIALTSLAPLWSGVQVIFASVVAAASVAIACFVLISQSPVVHARTAPAASRSRPQPSAPPQTVVAHDLPAKPGDPQAATLAEVSAESAPPPPPLNLETATAPEVLRVMAEKYASATSYFDKGTVKTVFIYPDGRRREDARPFTTAFVRDDRFRYEFSELRTAKEIRYIVWSDGTAAQVWWDIGRPPLKTTTLSSAIAGGTGISGASASMVPTLLLPDQLHGAKLSAMTDSVRGTDEAIDGVDCIRIQGNFGYQSTPIALWVEKQTGLVRQISSSHDLGSVRTETTTSYTGAINGSIPDELLQFDPPGKN